MKQTIKFFIIIITILSNENLEVSAQSTVEFTQYVLNPMSINPAYAGGQDALNVSLFYGKQWAGIEGSPKNMTFSADAPFANHKLGLGIMLTNERFGVSKQNEISTNYAFRILSPRSALSFGLGARVMLTNSKYSDLIALDPGDEIYLQDSKTYALANFSFGVHYSVKDFYVGFSIPQLLNYNFDIDEDKYLYKYDFKKYRYLLNTGFKLKAGNSLSIVPSLLLQYSSFNATNNLIYDVNSLLNYKDIFSLGGSYHNDRSFATLFQVKPNKQLSFAYSFTFETGRLNRYTRASHQIMLKYIFKYRVDAPNPLIF